MGYEVRDDDRVFWRTDSNTSGGNALYVTNMKEFSEGGKLVNRKTGEVITDWELYFTDDEMPVNKLFPERRHFVVWAGVYSPFNFRLLHVFNDDNFLSEMEAALYYHTVMNSLGIDVDPIPNYFVDPYYIDLAFPDKFVAVEVDGHDYHKSKEQRTHDARKDRFLMKNGWKVIRFTGTEVHRDVEACVEEILHFTRMQ